MARDSFRDKGIRYEGSQSGEIDGQAVILPMIMHRIQ